MSYNEFDINAAINPTVSRESVMLSGVGGISKVYASKSNSMEEFISGAIHDLSTVSCNAMFVNSSLNGLRDRLTIAAKVAKNVNTAKDMGREEFKAVDKMDPWQYAVESGIGNFFKKIWEAIVYSFKSILNAISKLVKNLQIFITNADAKAAAATYKYYVTNKALIERNNKANLKTKFNSMNWSVDAAKLKKQVESVVKVYVASSNYGSDDAKFFEKLSAIDLKQIKDTASFKKVAGDLFRFGGHFAFGDDASGKSMTNKISAVKADIEKAIDAIKSELKVPAKLTRGQEVAHACTVVGDGKVVQMTVEKMKGLSADFQILKPEWLANNIKTNVVALNNAMKSYSKYTKVVENVAKRFNEVNVDNTKSSILKSLSTVSSDLARTRLTTNQFFTMLILELELQAIRMRKNAHTALKVYIKGAASKEKTSKESVSADAMDLFRF